MVKKSLGQCYLTMTVEEYDEKGNINMDLRDKNIELSPEEAQFLFETLQNYRENQVDEDVEEIFS